MITRHGQGARTGRSAHLPERSRHSLPAARTRQGGGGFPVAGSTLTVCSDCKAAPLPRSAIRLAVDESAIVTPCRIKGAGTEDSPERSVLTVSQVYALADAVGPRYRVLILLATFGSLR